MALAQGHVVAILPELEIKMDARTSTLYAAATESLVSEASDMSTFEKMIQVAFTHSTLETFAKEVKDIEKLIKQEFEVSSMPGPWLSAKSVISSAMKLDLSLVDDNGGFYGKSFLQSKVNEKRNEEKDPVTQQEYQDKIIKLLMQVPEHLDAKSVLVAVNAFIKTSI